MATCLLWPEVVAEVVVVANFLPEETIKVTLAQQVLHLAALAKAKVVVTEPVVVAVEGGNLVVLAG
jgi:hypothetical protein